MEPEKIRRNRSLAKQVNPYQRWDVAEMLEPVLRSIDTGIRPALGDPGGDRCVLRPSAQLANPSLMLCEDLGKAHRIRSRNFA
jgi:hypothetical protein